MSLLGQYGALFTAKQKAEIVTPAGASSPIRPKKTAATNEVAPKYWLPHTRETPKFPG